jgi:glycosyltransferase involved in cell wall biosynthesis
MSPTVERPTVLIVGGPDVDARLELMERLRPEFECAAAGSAPELGPRFAAAGFKYYDYPLNRGVAPAADLFATYRLWQLCRALRPQIVHTFDPKPGVWGRLAARGADVPIIIGTLPGLGTLYAHDTLTTRLVRSIYQPLQTLACHVSQLTIFQNRDDACQFIDSGVVRKQSAMVIPGSGVSTDVFNLARVSQEIRMRTREDLGIAPNEIVVTMISRIIRSKGVPEFVTAAQEVRRISPNVRFLLVGAEDAESLDRLSRSELAELQKAVTWTGPRRDIPLVLALSDLFVLPSAYREGIPRVLLEAASMGLPIVTTDSPGCNEVVEDGVNGFLVPVHDAAKLARAIIRLVEQPELRRVFGQTSRRRAVEHFDLSLIVEQTRTIYRLLLAGRTLVTIP